MSAVIAHCVDESGPKFSRETIWLGIPQGKHITDTKRAQHFGGIWSFNRRVSWRLLIASFNGNTLI